MDVSKISFNCAIDGNAKSLQLLKYSVHCLVWTDDLPCQGAYLNFRALLPLVLQKKLHFFGTEKDQLLSTLSQDLKHRSNLCEKTDFIQFKTNCFYALQPQ